MKHRCQNSCAVVQVAASALVIFLACALIAFAQQPAPRNNPAQPLENPTAAMPTPAPRKTSVAIQFIGSTRFRENQLRTGIADPVETIERDGLTPATADDAAFFLGIFYRKNGYSQVDVKPRIIGPRELALVVAEGPLPRSATCRFTASRDCRRNRCTIT